MTARLPWRKWDENVRWADQHTVPVLVGAAGVESRELFRVIAPFPCTWRIIVGCQTTNIVNVGLALRLVLTIGLGAFTTEALFDIAFNAVFSFVVPASQLSGRIRVNDVVVGAGNFVFGAGTAPEISPFVGGAK
jgi:hypothetical protein